ncbi:hypothetical protein L1987_06785 [Smallanthus sonchifolius]|uniref:Uncharacterized protein n=1 Tax=Smallanthus sonchifolius TaxID=185202 RepID=A0ACB9JZG3_9ASTR|nr:hypothetical protein L1987_06785 [Smallanthus sonchifolius]
MENWEDVFKEVSDDEIEGEEGEKTEEEVIISDDSDDDNDDGGDDEGEDGSDARENEGGDDQYDGGGDKGGGKGNGEDDYEVNIEWSESDEDESLSEVDLEDTPPEFEKDGPDEKIIYETADGQTVETDFSQDRSKWFKPLPPIPDPLVQTIKPKKTEDTSNIIS